MDNPVSTQQVVDMLLQIVQIYNPEEDYKYLQELIYLEFDVSVSISIIDIAVNNFN